MDHLWGVVCGVFAAVSIISLNKTRKHNETESILFVMFSLGLGLILALFHGDLRAVSAEELFYLLLSGSLGVLGQLFITYGFLYVTAVEGSIIGSSRILMAALLAPFLVADPFLSLSACLGALLIFLVNVALAVRKLYDN